MLKLLAALFIASSFSFAYAASVAITVEVNGVSKQGLVYFDVSSNSHSGMDYIHLERLRVRVGRQGYNVAARSDIDEHICELLGYSIVDYRIIGNGGYEDAEVNVVRDNGRNILVPISFDRREISKHFPIESMTCARPSR